MSRVYNLYIAFGTIPKLYSKIDILNNKADSYAWFRFENKNSFSSENLKYFNILSERDIDFIKKDYIDIVNKIKDIQKKDKLALFNIITDDSRLQLILKPLIVANIYNKINEFIIISEGNITEFMYSDISKNDETYQKNRWNNIIRGIKNRVDSMDEELLIKNNACFWFSTNSNVRYLLPYKELLQNRFVENPYKERMNLQDFNIEDQFHKLSRENKRKIIDCRLNGVKINNKEKNIIILGTYDFGTKDFTTFVYKTLIDKTIYDYPDYKFFFKAHPLYPVSSNETLNNYLKTKEVFVLNNEIPIEILLWENNNICVGGFCSSVNTLISPERTLFFYGEKIGLSKLLGKTSFSGCKEYNILLSQNLAAELLKLKNNVEIQDNKKNEEILKSIGCLEKIIKENNEFYEKKLGELFQEIDYLKGIKDSKNKNYIKKIIKRFMKAISIKRRK